MDGHAQIKARLKRRRNELRHRLHTIKNDVRHVDGPLHPDFAEQAVERENEEVLDALDEAGRAEVLAIERALERIESGDYGICATCGETIPEKRLEVLPFSNHCVTCAEKEG